ncbi:MAG: hypothetical protein LBF41_00360 [Deltaproteobacteria bacterium]|jgi:hypothetical protein|nr:hypothetical protein [Deltaproteobacteria bacterium]
MRTSRTFFPVALLLFPLALFLQGCGQEKNPILGEWRITKIDTPSSAVNTLTSLVTLFKAPSVKFTETGLEYLNFGDGPRVAAVTYLRDKDGNWSYCDGSGRLCEKFDFSDEEKNRGRTTLLGVKLELSRVIPPDE